jgi:hypothetical protein
LLIAFVTFSRAARVAFDDTHLSTPQARTTGMRDVHALTTPRAMHNARILEQSPHELQRAQMASTLLPTLA